eukprot:scaffold124126_cov16-Prasinocladus_malaysianus.AAC.1
MPNALYLTSGQNQQCVDRDVASIPPYYNNPFWLSNPFSDKAHGIPRSFTDVSSTVLKSRQCACKSRRFVKGTIRETSPDRP